jgi:hypothetical protein
LIDNIQNNQKSRLSKEDLVDINKSLAGVLPAPLPGEFENVRAKISPDTTRYVYAAVKHCPAGVCNGCDPLSGTGCYGTVMTHCAKIAEKGKSAFLTRAEFPVMQGDMLRIDLDQVPYCKEILKKGDEKAKKDEQKECEDYDDPMEPQSLALSCLFVRLDLVLLVKVGYIIKVLGTFHATNRNEEIEGKVAENVFKPSLDQYGVWHIADEYADLCPDALVNFHPHTSALFFHVPWVSIKL